MKQRLKWGSVGMALCLPVLCVAEKSELVYEFKSEKYPYTVAPSGDNHTFEFVRNPGSEAERLKAALHVFQNVYGDETITPQYSAFFMKESARCFAFDARFYTYRVCILPNDYFPERKDRFWGFVNRLPNAAWLISRNLLPAGLVAVILYFLFRKSRSTPSL